MCMYVKKERKNERKKERKVYLAYYKLGYTAKQ